MSTLLFLKKLGSKWYWRCLCYLIVLFSVACVQILRIDKLMFPVPPATPVAGNCQIASGDAILDALYLKGREGMPTILFSHGNYQTLEDVKAFCEEAQQHGYSAMAYDYAGYGHSTGCPSEKQACMDIEVVFDYLIQDKKMKPDDIVIVGYSVGSGPSCHITTRHAVKALVLCAPFASAIRVVLPFSLPGDKFKNNVVLSSVEVPTLIFHGKKDRTIPFRNGELLYKVAKSSNKKLIVHDDADHDDLFLLFGETFWKELAIFLSCSPKQPARK